MTIRIPLWGLRGRLLCELLTARAPGRVLPVFRGLGRTLFLDLPAQFAFGRE